MPDMQSLHRPVDDGIVGAPGRRLAVKRPTDWLIEVTRPRGNQMRIGHRAESEDDFADTCQPFVRSRRVAVAEPDP
jgi:hypothetical protein